MDNHSAAAILTNSLRTDMVNENKHTLECCDGYSNNMII